jgi:hypothetical protein
MAGMLEKVWKESWEEDKYEDLEDCITENVLTYGNMGELFAELLEHHGGKYDERAMALLVEMMGEYIDENV